MHDDDRKLKLRDECSARTLFCGTSGLWARQYGRRRGHGRDCIKGTLQLQWSFGYCNELELLQWYL